jgi:hypothetical protein
VSDTPRQWLVDRLKQLVPVHREIVETIHAMFPDASDDDLLDTIAGESDLPDVIAVVLRQSIEREAHATALAALMQQMTERKARIERGSATLRSAALQAMQAGGIKRLNLPDMTVTVSPGKPKVIITDESLLPADLCRTKIDPDRKAIGAALADGKKLLGAELGNAVPYLTIRR